MLCSRMDGAEKRKVNQNECCGALHHIPKQSTNFARLSWDKYFTAQISLKQLFDYSDLSKRNIWLLRFLKNYYLATFFTSWHYLSHWHPIWRCENCFIELCNKVQLLCYPLFVAFEMSHLSYHLNFVSNYLMPVRKCHMYHIVCDLCNPSCLKHCFSCHLC